MKTFSGFGDDTRILWLGLGQLGSALARRLIDAGLDVEAVDPAPDATDAGCLVHRRIEHATHPFTAVVACLPTPDDLLAGVRFLCGLDKELRPEFIINLSTIGPVAATKAAELVGSSMVYVEAPVSGGVLNARIGNIAIFWGVSRAGRDVEIAGFLDLLAATVKKVGSVAEAARVKLVNNFISVANSFTVIEGLRLAARMGLDPVTTRDLLEHGTAVSYALRSTVKRPLTTGDTKTGFALRLALKDMRLLKESEDVASDLLDWVIAHLEDGMARGLGDHVFPMATLDSIANLEERSSN